MTDVISVRFRGGCKNYDFSPADFSVKLGDQVIVETAQGPEYAIVTAPSHEVADEAVVQPLASVLRMATENDLRTVEYNRKREREAFGICEKKIADHGLEMKLVSVSCSFDGSKIIFFFTADGRVDFRELVRDLAGVFRARIELRQIGVRDEAKMIGGLGICGRPFCCSQFLDGFLPVSIKMAKTQNLSLNPAKISGTCGRLMCCLKYEQNAYEDAVHRMPKNESFVQTPDGPGNVKSVDLLREKVKVSLDSAPEPLKCYHNCELCVLRNGKGVRDGIEIPAERPARFVEEKKPEDEFFAPAVVSSPLPQPFFTDSAPAEEADVPSGEEGEDKPRRRRRSRGRRGPKPEGAAAPAAQPQQPARGEGEPRRQGPRPPRPSGEGKGTPPSGGDAGRGAPPPGGETEGDAPRRRRAHHRGGRRHRGGGEGAPGGSAPAGDA